MSTYYMAGPTMFSRRYVVGRRRYWRTARVVMESKMFNAAARDPEVSWFESTWTQAWYGAKVLTVYECFPEREKS